jgi:hypothetical protein
MTHAFSKLAGNTQSIWVDELRAVRIGVLPTHNSDQLYKVALELLLAVANKDQRLAPAMARLLYDSVRSGEAVVVEATTWALPMASIVTSSIVYGQLKLMAHHVN